MPAVFAGCEVPRRPSGRDREEQPPTNRVPLRIRLRRTAAEAPRRAVSGIREVTTNWPPIEH